LITGINIVAVPVDDIDEAVHFFCDCSTWRSGKTLSAATVTQATATQIGRPAAAARPCEPPRARRPLARAARAGRPGADRTRARQPLPLAESGDHRARQATRTAGNCGRACTARAARLRRRHRREAAGRDRPDQPLQNRRTTRPPRRRRTARSKLRQKATPPARPWRQPATQRRALPNRDHPVALPAPPLAPTSNARCCCSRWASCREGVFPMRATTSSFRMVSRSESPLRHQCRAGRSAGVVLAWVPASSPRGYVHSLHANVSRCGCRPALLNETNHER
jgi:hypothetical protein